MAFFTEYDKAGLEGGELKKQLLSFQAESGGTFFKPELSGLGDKNIFHSLLVQLTKDSLRI